MKKIEKLFVCVGAQKAGTTWLHGVLSKDNRLKTPLFRKEVQYFNYKYMNSPLINQWRAAWFINLSKKKEFQEVLFHYLQQNMPKNRLLPHENKTLLKRIGLSLRPLNDEWYCDYMALGPKKECAVDISPEYALIGKTGFENIRAVTEDLRLVFILRDPVERCWSGMIQEIKHRPDAKVLLNRMMSATVESLVERAKKPNIQKRSEYLNTFEAIKAAGLNDCLKVMYYDDIVENPSIVIDSVYAHIGIEKPVVSNEVLEKVVHKSPPIAIPEQFILQMRKVYTPMLMQLNSEFISLPEAWKNCYEIE